MQQYGSGNRNANNSTNKITLVLLIIYLIILFWILVLKLGVRFSYMEYRSVNLIPFSEPLISNGRIDFSEMILNAVIFVPLGIYAGMLCKAWAFGKKLFLFFLISSMFESLQYILRIGAFDITDIITNSLGGIIGLMLYIGLEKVFRNNVKVQRYLNVIAAIGTVVLISLLGLLKLNMLPIRYQ